MSFNSSSIEVAPEIYVVEFENDVEDAVALKLHDMKTSLQLQKSYRRFLVFLLVGFAVIVGGLFLFDAEFGIEYLPRLCMWFLVFVGYYAFFCWRRKRAALNQMRKQMSDGSNRSFLARQRITLSREGLRSECAFGSGVLKWEGIERVVRLPEYLFIYESSTLAHIVPRRAFADEKAFQHFAAAAERFHRAARPGPCRKCGYDLMGNTTGKCPECGTTIQSLPGG